jgi:membrane protease YdiL (CAAX protease family)
VLSVVPQEILYRVFLFRRSRALLASGGARVASSAVLFGFAHVIYGNWIAVTLSALGGILFAWTYERTGSLKLVAHEHALYGGAEFTLGLGPYFYERASLFTQ